jgi:hypothetical protein
LLLVSPAWAEPGEDGNVTITGTVTLNSYSRLAAAAPANSATLTLVAGGAAALALPACAAAPCVSSAPILAPLAGGVGGFGTALSVGDLLMIYQPQDLDSGAIDTTNTPSFGDVTNYGSAGRYELVYVLSVAGDVVTIQTASGVVNSNTCTGLQRSYDAGAMIVRVPQIRNLTVTSGSIVAPAWNGQVGGVVALDVRPGRPLAGTLEDWLNANGTVQINVANGINVSGRGFRGGAEDNAYVGNLSNKIDYRNPALRCLIGARKGESIFGYSGSADTAADATTCAADADATGLHSNTLYGYGRGKLANGGGGGSEHNAGGGGGANGGAAAWTGAGNPDPDPPGTATSTVWLLEDDLEAADSAPLACTGTPCNALNASSGGGRGGYGYSSANGNALTQGPGDSVWGGFNRRNRGGLGGRPLARGANGVARLFFGGGGGTGDSNNLGGGPGGRGGGLVFLMAHRIQTSLAASTVLIRADGAVGGNSGDADAAGGGGGGGTIVMAVARALSGSFSASGGTGGSQVGGGSQAEGPGGGGGGGVIAASWYTGTPTLTVAGGVNGTTSATQVNEFSTNGATRGGVGEVIGAPTAGNPVYACISGGCSDGNCGFTTPATSAYFRANRVAGQLQIAFDTSSELNQAGYFIESERAGRSEQLSSFLPRQSGAPEEPRSYTLTVPDDGAESLWLVEVDRDGKQTRRGPYRVGVPTGSPVVNSAYDWSAAIADLNTRAPQGTTSNAAYLSVATKGIYRVTYEQLLAAGVDLSGVPVSELALSDARGPVARRVTGGAVFGTGSAVEFYGDPQADLHNSKHSYLLASSGDATQVIDLPLHPRSVAQGAPASIPSAARSVAKHTPANYFYDPVVAADSPWYMYDIFANSGQLAGRNMTIAAPGAVASEGTLTVVLTGFVDLPPAALPDHHVRVLFNGTVVADERFDGLVQRKLSIPVSQVQASNVVRIEVPGDTGQAYDFVTVRSAELNYPTLAQVSGSGFVGTGVSSIGERSDLMFADGLGDLRSCFGNTVVHQKHKARRTATSRTWVVGPQSVSELDADAGHAFNGSYADSAASTLIVAETSQLPSPTVSAAPGLAALPTSPAEYLVVTHPLFADQANQLAAHRQTQGLSTAVVDVEQIYRRYSAGNPQPEAIRAYLREHAAAMGTRYLVLFGGANYNSVGLRGAAISALSYIPTFYTPLNRYSNFVPADAFYGDLTGDQVAEIAVGRVPARTVAEATESVRKLLAYETQPAAGSFLVTSGAVDASSGFSFRAASGLFADELAPSWQQTRIDVETLGTAAARVAILDAWNQGKSLISFTGHSGPTSWDQNPAVINSDNIAALPANSNQPIVLQFGCWTTYFVSPVVNAMGNTMVLSPNRGASAVFGSTVLLDQPNHDRIAAAMAPRLIPGARIGDVIEETRRELAGLRDVLDGGEVSLGISLLGDPASPIR